MHNNGSPPPTGALVHHSPWDINRRVLGALIIREMLTRYGRNNIGFLWLFVEPMIFTLVVVMIRTFARGTYEGSVPIIAFAVTGWPTLMLWRNMASRLLGALKSNRALLHHRQVRIIDIYLARIILEQIATTTSLILVAAILFLMGWLTPPEDILQVVEGWLLLGWFGAGLALVVGSLSERYQIVGNLWRPSIYIFIPISGIAFLVSSLPPKAQEWVLWVPMVHAVEFIREGWFGSAFVARYDLGYLITVNLVMMLLGLGLVRQVGLDEIEE